MAVPKAYCASGWFRSSCLKCGRIDFPNKAGQCIVCKGDKFEPWELNLCKKLEDLITGVGYQLFAPRKDNLVKANASYDDCRKGFLWNCEKVAEADIMIANVDQTDPGVMMEMGLAYNAYTPIVTFSASGRDLNLMLAQATIAHVKTEEALKDVLTKFFKVLPVENVTDPNWLKVVAEVQAEHKYMGAII
jgi:nucleoside 2-deoxyribosyltransferase